jgi:outer membrane protein assembly factor BamB
MLRSAILVALLFASASNSLAEDWPQFRGPTGQGISNATKLPAEWGPEKNIVWKSRVPGQGWSSPVVVAGKIALTSAELVGEEDEQHLSLRALLIDARTGEIAWNVEVFSDSADNARGVHFKNNHASPTPVLRDKLYVHFGPLGTACLNLSGEILWKQQELKYNSVHGPGGSPVLAGELLLLGCDGLTDPFVVALKTASGKVAWKYSRPPTFFKKIAFSTPLVITAANRRQAIIPGADWVSALDPETGKQLWRVRYDGYSVVPCPVFGQRLVFVSSGYDSPEILAIRPDGTGDVTKTHIAWRTKKGAPTTPSPLIVGEELYLVTDDGVASCYAAETGEPHWQKRLSGAFSASPVYADGKLYFQSEAGRTFVLKPGRVYDLLAENDLGEPTQASYAIADGAIFLRTDQHLYRIEERP